MQHVVDTNKTSQFPSLSWGTRILMLVIEVSAFLLTDQSFAMSYSKPSGVWLRDYRQLTYGLELPVRRLIATAEITERKIKTRILKGGNKQGIEPLYLKYHASQAGVSDAVSRFAKKKTKGKLKEVLESALSQAKKDKQSLVKKVIDPSVYRLLDKDKLIKQFSTRHYKLSTKPKNLYRNKKVVKNLLTQISPFFEKDERKIIQKKIMRKQALNVDSDLLPGFPRKVIKKYVVYRGPNCFHAAMAFQNRSLTKSSYFNVTRERGYHPAMINYDELWRILDNQFYQVNPTVSDIKYGDVLVFFDLPAKRTSAINFRWIRHTATYLFNNYTFSKGSKSADTPYTVKTLEEEWETWRKYTKNLAVKIFRRSSKHVSNRPPVILTDWIY